MDLRFSRGVERKIELGSLSDLRHALEFPKCRTRTQCCSSIEAQLEEVHVIIVTCSTKDGNCM
jgi:hypothetical protein